ncbi:MAG: glycosyltransferase family 39 protein [bacterium]
MVNWVESNPVTTLIICSGAFLALGWWQDGINLDSTTYAVIARNIAEHGGWFSPTYTPFYHTHFAEHPYLVMWVQAVIFKIFGTNDSTARIFGQLCTMGSVIAVYYIGKEIQGKALGLLSGLILILTYNFMQGGNSTLLDVPMTCFILIALWGIIRLIKTELQKINLSLYVITGLSLGFAFLAKGVVSGPAWLAFIIIAFLYPKKSIMNKEFWLIPLFSLGLIALFLLGDLLFNNRHFCDHYFMVQVWRRFVGGGPEIHTDWYEFTWRFIKLYLPFVILLPIGIYLAVKKRAILLLPIGLTLLLYFIFYSSAAKLYYHYFMPAYALSSVIAAYALYSFFKEKWIFKLASGFMIIWLILGTGVTIAGVKIHQIRSPRIYNLTERMSAYLENSKEKQGLLIDEDDLEWDYIAKTDWYWRSDIKSVRSIEEAVENLHDSSNFSYIIIPNDLKQDNAIDTGYNIIPYVSEKNLTIYIPANQ